MKKTICLIVLALLSLYVLSLFFGSITTVGEILSCEDDSVNLVIVGSESVQKNGHTPEAKSGVVYVGQELEISYDEIFLGDPSALVPGDKVKICYLM